MREFLTVLLEKQGHRVIAAADGEQALELIAQKPPDLVISDIRMPKVDGVSLLTGIRKSYPRLPVVMMTAYASMDSTIQTMRLGADDYITEALPDRRDPAGGGKGISQDQNPARSDLQAGRD
ncbi:MAG: response regulator [Candidatus Methylomirabilis sp.]|nr:response regulator [Candidatus Methylomirabilis sp.]